MAQALSTQYGPDVPRDSPLRRQVARELASQGKDYTAGEKVELSVNELAVEFREVVSEETTQIAIEVGAARGPRPAARRRGQTRGWPPGGVVVT